MKDQLTEALQALKDKGGKARHKIEPRSIRDEIAKNAFIRTIDGQIKKLLETSTDPAYVVQDGNLVIGPKGATAKRVDALIGVREDEIVSIINRMQNPLLG